MDRKQPGLGVWGWGFAVIVFLAAQARVFGFDKPGLQNQTPAGQRRIIVKYKSAEGAAASDSLRAKRRVRKSERVFKSLDRRLRQGKKESDLHGEIRARFAKRSRRIAR